MSPGIKNPFKKDLLRRQFDSCVLCYFTRHKDLFREDGTRHTGNGVANQFWWGFDGARKPEQWDGSRDTPAYASYRAGEAIAAYEAALAAKDADIARLREENEKLASFAKSFNFTCAASFYNDCYLNINEPNSAGFRLGNGSQFSKFIAALEERRRAALAGGSDAS